MICWDPANLDIVVLVFVNRVCIYEPPTGLESVKF